MFKWTTVLTREILQDVKGGCLARRLSGWLSQLGPKILASTKGTSRLNLFKPPFMTLTRDTDARSARSLEHRWEKV